MPDSMGSALTVSTVDLLVVFAVLAGLVGVLRVQHLALRRWEQHGPAGDTAHARPGGAAAGAEFGPSGRTGDGAGAAEVSSDMVSAVTTAIAAFLGEEGRRATRTGFDVDREAAGRWALAGRLRLIERARRQQGGYRR